MSIRWKARIVDAALLLLALWPIVHIALAWRYDVSPWKLAGWGMYSTPRFGLIGMEVYGRDPASGRWEQLVAPSADVQTIAVGFLERHRWLRRLTGADELVAAVADSHPDWNAVRIVVAYPHIDLRTGMVVLTQDERDYALR